MSGGDHDIVLEARGISKSFPGVKALDAVSLTLRQGKLTALLGENGAGKSTLMNVIAGVLRPDEGEIRLAGELVRFANPRQASEAGVAVIHQELNLVPNLTVAENVFLGREPRNRLGLIDAHALRERTAALLDRLDLAVDPSTETARLRVGQQQIIEIAKALSADARVLIMDEPTSAITDREIDVLFGIIEGLKRQGVAVAYITHKLEELTRIGDDAVVMRDGKRVGGGSLDDLDHDGIIRMMVGRDVRTARKQSSPPPRGEVLRVEDLAVADADRPGDFLLREISLRVHRGQVLGLFGLMGAGRTELLEAIFGLHATRTTGRVLVDGSPVEIGSPVDAIRHGIALAPEDRKAEGLVLGMSVAQNASLASLARLKRYGFVDESAERDMVGALITRFQIKTPSQQQIVGNLSGGNQQKVILGKWISTQPRVLLLDEPTRGIDVNAKAEIYALIEELAADGLAVVAVSSELPEIQAIADRIVVLCEGRKTAEFDRAEANEEALMKAALPARHRAAQPE